MQYWGYQHRNGTVRVKQLTRDWIDIETNAHSMPYIDKVYVPFKAKNEKDAERILLERITNPHYEREE